MAKTFWIENKKSRIGVQAVLSAKNILDMVEGLESYSYDAVFLRQPLNRLQHIECGIVGRSSFLFRISYDDWQQAYQLHLPDFFTETDWQIAEQTLQALSHHLGNPVQGLEDFHLDVYFRQLLEEKLADKSVRFLSLQGIFHPVLLDRKSLLHFFESHSPITEFEKMVQKVQQCSGYFPKVKFYRSESDRVYGVYNLAEGVQTVLPREPFVPTEYLEQVLDQEIDWELQLVKLVVADGEETYESFASLPYAKFWEKIPAEKMEKLDANHYCIDTLSYGELQDLVAEKV